MTTSRRSLTAALFFSALVAGCPKASTSSAPSPTSTSRSARIGYDGFAIEPLASSHAAGMVFMMALPATQAFAPNVNVVVQPFVGSIDDYAKTSAAEFELSGMHVIRNERGSDSALTIEYAGTMAGRSMHWYARAMKSGGSVYLVTATALESQWPTVSVSLIACVDSFEAPKNVP